MNSKAKENLRQRFFFDVFVVALLILVAIFSWASLAYGWLPAIVCGLFAIRFTQVEYCYFYSTK